MTGRPWKNLPTGSRIRAAAASMKGKNEHLFLTFSGKGLYLGIELFIGMKIVVFE